MIFLRTSLMDEMLEERPDEILYDYITDLAEKLGFKSKKILSHKYYYLMSEAREDQSVETVVLIAYRMSNKIKAGTVELYCVTNYQTMVFPNDRFLLSSDVRNPYLFEDIQSIIKLWRNNS